MNAAERTRLFIKITRDTLPQVKDKYPFLYLEYGRLEIDDSSVKWINSDGDVVRLPIATINCLLLGPGTSVTHESVKVLAAANCGLCWVGEDGLLFYASGHTPTSHTRNLRKQMLLAADEKTALKVAQRFYQRRFPDMDITNKNLQELMGLEGHRVRLLYAQKAQEYNVGWKGRRFSPGSFELSDLTNQILTATNAALYGLLTAAVTALGYSPHIGFIHSGSPLPFIYDLADIYKEYLCVDTAFSLSLHLAGQYNKHRVSETFRQRVQETHLLANVVTDIDELLRKI